MFVQALGNKFKGYPLIGIARIAKLHSTKDTDGRPAYEAIDSAGEHFATIGAHELHDAMEPRGVVSEASGSVLVAPLFGEDGNVACFSRFPIIAWKIGGRDVVEPVVCDLLPTYWAVELRENGVAYAWVVPALAICDSLDELREYFNVERAANESARTAAARALARDTSKPVSTQPHEVTANG
jgi:hypothetical protein